MWPFKSKPKGEPVLRVLIGEREVCAVFAAELPAEKLPTAELRQRREPLRFVDSQGNVRSFDMSSPFEEGARYFHMSVRVGATFAVMPDGILTASKHEDPQQAFANGARGLRLQPFFLPESPGRPEDLVGRGLFMRGLHYSGMVTPGSVSHLCACDACQRNFRLQSFHAGFSNLVYFYCSGGLHTLVASSYADDAPPVLGKADPDALARFESRLPRCSECQGEFRYLNPLLCPHCEQPYIDFTRHPEDRESEYYGNYLYGAQPQQLPGS